MLKLNLKNSIKSSKIGFITYVAHSPKLNTMQVCLIKRLVHTADGPLLFTAVAHRPHH